MRSICVTIALIAVTLTAVILIGLTYHRGLESHETVRCFEMLFTGLDRHDDPHRFDVGLTLTNGGEVPAAVETLLVLLFLEGRLIASENVHPDRLQVDPGAEESVSLELISRLDEETLPAPGAEIPDEYWAVRLYATVTHPVREGEITLHRESQLKRRSQGDE